MSLKFSVCIYSCPQFSDTFLSGTMKLIQIAAFVFLFLVVTIPDQTDAAVPKRWFKNVASQLGEKPRKNYYYARCNTREAPPEICCPEVVYGKGWTRNLAQASVRWYASTFGELACAAYVRHCDINKYKG